MPSYLAPIVNFFTTMFAGTAATTVTGTTEQTILPPGVGSKTLNAGMLRPGTAARLVVRGLLTTPLVAGTATLKVKLGGVTVATASVTNLLGNLVGAGFLVSLTVQCYEAGATGKVAIAGEARYPSGLLSTRSTVDLTAVDPVIVNTQADQTLDVTVTFGLTGHTLKGLTATLETLAP